MRLTSRAAIPLLLALVSMGGAVLSLAWPAAAAEDLSAQARRVVQLANEERLRAGILPLKWNDSLAAAGAAHVQDMASRNYFAHNSPEGITPTEWARRAGYQAYGWGGLFVGENLARGYPSPEAAMQGWMGSDGHRSNLLNPKYRETGVAVAVASSGAKVWAQEFGSRPKALPVFIDGDAPTTGTLEVTLTFSSEDVSAWGSLGAATALMVSNSPDFAGASWEPFSRGRAWTLGGGSALQTVYVRVRDGNGVTAESSDDIQLVGYQALGVPRARPGPEFKLGFLLLASQIPEVVGLPLENERSAPNGDSLQQTTSGLLAWRKLDNWTAFTNGHRSWINGPFGVQQRGNGEKFGWER